MRVSKNKVNPHLNKELVRTLHQAIADLKTPTEVEAFLTSFLSETEHAILAKRLAVAYWLDKKRSYENIKDNLKVSSATISVIQEGMGSDGVKIILQKIKAEEWANVWAIKIQKFLKRD